MLAVSFGRPSCGAAACLTVGAVTNHADWHPWIWDGTTGLTTMLCPCRNSKPQRQHARSSHVNMMRTDNDWSKAKTNA